MRAKDAVGRYGEDVAARHLAAAGLTIVERNWRCAEGELDIVAREGGALVVCEVKTRSSAVYGGPFEAVTPAKAARLRRLAARWLRERAGQVPGGPVAEVRIDVVGVQRQPRGAATVEHRRGVA